MSWRWEYDPDEEYVVGGAPPAFVVEVEKRADELVRAAEARRHDDLAARQRFSTGEVWDEPLFSQNFEGHGGPGDEG
ncbi:hypothetical protein EDD98_1874 [Streptomyces sp. PanSC19]|uniref:hypothetical protein n=1 Tax=Streptomyces sp. PanSC19 TaxID=1520455 RepID=UPI000F4A2F66|nr:hypothetical protein [Streptomyces sp. PanSC19]ROQ32876.1 hypothetical protein EDD98_1874 [Streptomyces sp. PanSC19]